MPADTAQHSPHYPKDGVMPWLQAIPGALRLIPRSVWIALAGALLWHFALSWHRGQIKAHDTTLTAARDAQWQLRLDQAHAEALQWKIKAQAESRAIAATERKLNDETNRRIVATAAGLRLRGAGQAAAPAGCRPVDHSRLAASASGPEPGRGLGTDAAAPVPATDGPADLALVSWDWLVSVIAQGDANRAEALTWRSNDAKQRSAWERLRAQTLESPSATKGLTDERRP